jgi:hypothetical protein
MRAWTFLYFVPEITQFATIPPESPLSPELAARVSLWAILGWARRALIAATGLAVLLALMTPADGRKPSATPERRRARRRAAIG